MISSAEDGHASCNGAVFPNGYFGITSLICLDIQAVDAICRRVDGQNSLSNQNIVFMLINTELQGIQPSGYDFIEKFFHYY